MMIWMQSIVTNGRMELANIFVSTIEDKIHNVSDERIYLSQVTESTYEWKVEWNLFFGKKHTTIFLISVHSNSTDVCEHCTLIKIKIKFP